MHMSPSVAVFSTFLKGHFIDMPYEFKMIFNDVIVLIYIQASIPYNLHKS